MSAIADQAPWQEPVEGHYPDPSMLSLSGTEQLRAFVDGRAPNPPLSYLTGMKPTEAGLGTSAFTMPATRWLLSPQGVISVGTLSILADGPLGTAVLSALPPRTGYATSELSLRVLRPARDGGVLVARGELVHVGRSLALSRVQILDGEGHLLADGSSLCFLMPPDDRVEADPAVEPGPTADGPDPPRLYERPVLGDVIDQEVWDRMSGMEILDAQMRDELPRPPIHYLTGAGPVEYEDGEVTYTMPCHEWLCSPLRTVQGGTIALLADHALSTAIQTKVPAGAALAAMDLKVNFLRPVMPDGRELRATGRVRHGGRTIAVADAEVVNADGKTVALATGSAMILAGRPAALGYPD